MQKSLVRSSVSNDDGRFELEGVPAGRYALVSSKRTYVERGWDELDARAFLTREVGERRDVTATLDRGGVISGRVTHDDNTPVVGARVQVYGRFVGPAQRHLYQVIFGTTQSFTNSRGEYRLIGVPPDAHAVSVSPNSGEFLGPGGMPMWTAIGYYPRASRIEEAQPVQVSAGEERTGTDIVLTQFSVVEVDVEALLPEPRTVTRMELWCGPPAFGSSGAPTESSAVSTFRVRCPVTSPGSHEVAVAVATADTTPEVRQAGMLWGSTVVMTSDRAMTVSLGVAPGIRLAGRVTIESGPSGTALATPGSSDAPVLAPSLRYVDGPFLHLARIYAYPDAAGRFVLASVPAGRYAVTAAPPKGWIATAATLDGRDVLDQVFEVPASGSNGELNVTFAPGNTRLEGEIVDARGVPLGHRGIAVFPADRKYWQFDSRRYAITSSDEAGRYAFEDLPPGDYFVTTAAAARWGVAADPRELEPLISSALRVSVEHNVVTVLRVTGDASSHP
jgi:protocatechuate 3,4-dioxygenase beta subunit